MNSVGVSWMQTPVLKTPRPTFSGTRAAATVTWLNFWVAIGPLTGCGGPPSGLGVCGLSLIVDPAALPVNEL